MADQRIPLSAVQKALEIMQKNGTLEDFLKRYDRELLVPQEVYDAAIAEIERGGTTIMSGSGTCSLCPRNIR